MVECQIYNDGGMCTMDVVVPVKQIPPTVTWGKQFFIAPFCKALVHHYAKIVTSEIETTITQIFNKT